MHLVHVLIRKYELRQSMLMRGLNWDHSWDYLLLYMKTVMSGKWSIHWKLLTCEPESGKLGRGMLEVLIH